MAFLPAQDAQTIMLAIDKLARIDAKETGSMNESSISQISNDLNKDSRSIDMKRADALTQLASAYLSDSLNENFNHRRPVTVNLTIDLPTLLGLAENPGQIAGYGAIPASVARELAADAKWRIEVQAEMQLLLRQWLKFFEVVLQSHLKGH